LKPAENARILFLAIALFAISDCASKPAADDKVCTFAGASHKGSDDAQNSRPMDAMKVAEGCDPSVRAAVEKWYREAYGNSDVVEAADVDSSEKAQGPRNKPECHVKADCSDGKWCRDRGDGVRLCLGSEPRGGFCQYEDDCGHGLLCGKGKDKIGKCE